MRVGPCPAPPVPASRLGAGRLTAIACGPGPEPATRASTASPPATSACHFRRRALSWGYGGLTSLASPENGCVVVAGPSPVGFKGRGRSHREREDAGGDSVLIWRRETGAPKSGNCSRLRSDTPEPPRSPPRAWPGLALRSPTFALPAATPWTPSNLLYKTTQHPDACARRPAARDTQGNPDNVVLSRPSEDRTYRHQL